MNLHSASFRGAARSSGCSANLPQATPATDEEVLTLIHTRQLFGLGIGYVDAHLLAATMLTTGASLWTRDKRLAAIAARYGLAGGNGPVSSRG